MSILPYELHPMSDMFEEIERDQKIASDAILVLERQRPALLLAETIDDARRLLDYHIAELNEQLDQLARFERDLRGVAEGGQTMVRVVGKRAP